MIKQNKTKLQQTASLEILWSFQAPNQQNASSVWNQGQNIRDVGSSSFLNVSLFVLCILCVF